MTYSLSFHMKKVWERRPHVFPLHYTPLDVTNSNYTTICQYIHL